MAYLEVNCHYCGCVALASTDELRFTKSEGGSKIDAKCPTIGCNGRVESFLTDYQMKKLSNQQPDIKAKPITPGRCPHCDGLVADKIHDGPFCFCDPSGPFYIGSRVHITWKDPSFDWNEFTIVDIIPGGLRGRVIRLKGETQNGINHDGKPFEVPLHDMKDVQPSTNQN